MLIICYESMPESSEIVGKLTIVAYSDIAANCDMHA